MKKHKGERERERRDDVDDRCQETIGCVFVTAAALIGRVSHGAAPI